jgi:hypothetical protein
MLTTVRRASLVCAIAASVMLAGGFLGTAAADDSEQILSVDHYVTHVSTVPAIAGQSVQLYVRERAEAGTVLRMGD